MQSHCLHDDSDGSRGDASRRLWQSALGTLRGEKLLAKGPTTVAAYMAGLEPHAAHIVEQVRAAMRRVAPDLREAISYQILRFDYAGAYLYAGAWKAHLGLYPVYPADDPALEAAIAPYRSGRTR